MDSEWEIEQEIFKHPFNCVLSGPTSCGKTYLLHQILKYKDVMIKDSPRQIILCYKTWQPRYDLIKADVQNIRFHQGVLESSQIDSLFNTILIFDDLNNECINSEPIMNLYTVGSHHQNISVFVLSQNIFSKGRFSRELSLNSNYLIIFMNPRDQLQLKILSSQMFPGKTKFLVEAFNDATKLAHGYLLLDLKQDTLLKNRVRTSILPKDVKIIYTAK